MALPGDGNRTIGCPGGPARCDLGPKAVLGALGQDLADLLQRVSRVADAANGALQPAAKLGIVEGDGDAGHLG